MSQEPLAMANGPMTLKSHVNCMYKAPIYVGKWVIGGSTGIHVMQEHKPRWLTRWAMKHVFEIEWADLEKK